MYLTETSGYFAQQPESFITFNNKFVSCWELSGESDPRDRAATRSTRVDAVENPGESVEFDNPECCSCYALIYEAMKVRTYAHHMTMEAGQVTVFANTETVLSLSRVYAHYV